MWSDGKNKEQEKKQKTAVAVAYMRQMRHNQRF